LETAMAGVGGGVSVEGVGIGDMPAIAIGD